MQKRYRTGMSKIAGVALAVLGTSSAAQAERIFGLTSSNTIVTFDSATPGVITSSGIISGLAVGDTLIGLDLRPANRTLYTLSRSGRLYAITGNSNGYVATSVGNLLTPLSGRTFGFDFNPTVDRLRVVSNANQNLRINPNNPALAGPPAGTLTDTPITVNGSSNSNLLAVGYTNSRPGVTSTVLYGLDGRNNTLVRSTNANAGTYVTTNLMGNTFSSFGTRFTQNDRVGLDISGATGFAFAHINDNFFGVNLSSGAGSLVGTIGASGITGLTAGSVPEPASWAMLIVGFGLVGATMRRRNPVAVAA